MLHSESPQLSVSNNSLVWVTPKHPGAAPSPSLSGPGIVSKKRGTDGKSILKANVSQPGNDAGRKGNLCLENINKQALLKIDLISFEVVLKCSDNCVVALRGKLRAASVFSFTWESDMSGRNFYREFYRVFCACFGRTCSISDHNTRYCYVLSTLSLNSVCLGLITVL